MRSNLMLIGIACAVALTVAVVGSYWSPRPAGHLPTFSADSPDPATVHVPFAAPAFSLTDQNGRTIDPASLRGNVYLVDFIYIGCDSTCTILDAALAKVQHQLLRVEVASFCVDPYVQQPSVLASYNRRYGGDAERWHLLSADENTMFRAAQGFAMVAKDQPNPGWVDFQTWIMLVDGQGNVRAVYDGLWPDVAERLVRDVKAVQTGAAPQPATPATAPATEPAAKHNSASMQWTPLSLAIRSLVSAGPRAKPGANERFF
jgi:protein SCO1/2